MDDDDNGQDTTIVSQGPADQGEQAAEEAVDYPADLPPRPPGRLSFVQEHRRITDTVFEWRTARRDPPQIDGREIVWADWLTLAELRQAKLAQPLLAYVTWIGSTTR